MDEFSNNKWKSGDRITCENFAFTGNSGIQVVLQDNPSSSSFVSLFLSEDFFQTITENETDLC